MEKLNIKAKVLLMLLSSTKCLTFLKGKRSFVFSEGEAQEIYEWLSKAFKQIVDWIEGDMLDAGIFYKEFIYTKVANSNGYYNHSMQPKESDAYNSCLSTIYFSCKSMMMSASGVYDKYYNNFPSDIAEVTNTTVLDCLKYAQKVSNNPELEIQWQQNLIQRLLNDYPVIDRAEMGPNIPRRYIEEIFGQDLPF